MRGSESESPREQGLLGSLLSVNAETFSVANFVHALRRRWMLAVAVAVVVLAAVAVYTALQKPMYEARGIIQFDPRPPQPLGQSVSSVIQVGADTFVESVQFVTTQAAIIKSSRLSETVAHSLGLERNAAFLAQSRPGEVVQPREVSVRSAASRLSSRVLVTPIKTSHLVEITYRDADPARAERILRTLLDTYVTENLESKVEMTSDAGDWLQKQLATLKDDLYTNERALHDFKLQKNILSVSMHDQNNILKDQIKTFSDELTLARADEAKVASRLTAVRKLTRNLVDLRAAGMLETDTLGKSGILDAYTKAEQDLAALSSSNRGPQHPDVLAAKARSDATRDALVRELEGIRSALSVRLTTLRDQTTRFGELLAESKQEAFELNRMEIDYDRLRRSRDNTEKLYSVVLERSKTTDITRMLRVNNVRVMEPPVEPGGPVTPRVPLNLAVGGILGLILGAGAAFAREQKDHTLKTPEDAERELSLPVLGVLPDVADGASRQYSYYSTYGARRRKRGAQAKTPPNAEPTVSAELLPHERPRSGTAEAARALRTNILLMSPDQPQKSLLVTSARPGEGKTTVACAIAISMAQAGQRVALVDCDFRRSRVHKVFGKSASIGVTSLLLDPSQLDELDLSSQVPNLSVLPAGPHPPDPAELLHSAAFADLLKVLTSRFDRVVLDSPPVGPVTDAAILSTIADGTLLVVRANKTHRAAARQAMRVLTDLSKRTLGIVFNAVPSGTEYKHGSGYYYYQQYGDYTDPTRPDARGDDAGADHAGLS